MSWLVLYFTPIGLGLFLLLLALAKRFAWRPLELAVSLVGFPCDVFCNYSWFQVFGFYPWAGLTWRQRTVTARTAAAVKAGESWAIQLARVLNWLIPGHV